MNDNLFYSLKDTQDINGHKVRFRHQWRTFGHEERASTFNKSLSHLNARQTSNHQSFCLSVPLVKEMLNSTRNTTRLSFGRVVVLTLWPIFSKIQFKFLYKIQQCLTNPIVNRGSNITDAPHQDSIHKNWPNGIHFQQRK